MKLKIGHHTVRVVPIHEELDQDLNVYGDFSGARKRIRLLGRASPTDQAETLIHEILHACFDAHGWPKEMDEETTCQLVARGLSQVFQANPKLHAILNEALTAGRPVV